MWPIGKRYRLRWIQGGFTAIGQTAEPKYITRKERIIKKDFEMGNHYCDDKRAFQIEPPGVQIFIGSLARFGSDSK
jgi:hypothetical protein